MAKVEFTVKLVGSGPKGAWCMVELPKKISKRCE